MSTSSTMDDQELYLQIGIANDAGIIFLCVLGGVLNSVMLYLLLSKKQVRSSVHTVYMVQIALTDLLVCAVWMILASVKTHQLLQITKDTPVEHGISNGTSTYHLLLEDDDDGYRQNRTWMIMYYWYNFHYYTNILLLASMSVERCAAVWKAMRCQRYQYNRKIIVGVSVLMWVVAFAFVLPNLINPDLIVTDSDSTKSIGKGPLDIFKNRRPQDHPPRVELPKDTTTRSFEEKDSHQQDLDDMYACFTIMMKAIQEGDKYVRDYGNVSVQECSDNMLFTMVRYPGTLPQEYLGENVSSEDHHDIQSLFDNIDGGTDWYYDPSFLDDLEILNETTGDLIGMDVGMFYESLTSAVNALLGGVEYKACDPKMSDAARIYVLVINLVLGFFVPFTIIVFSYVSIAYMIGKRARSRMQPDMSEASTTRFAQQYLLNNSTTNVPVNLREGRQSRTRRDSVSRRMSDFMRSVIHRKPNGGRENRSFFTDSDRDVTPYDSRHNVPYSLSSRQCEDSSVVHAKSDNAIQYAPMSKSPEEEKSSEDDPLHDPELQEAIRQLSAVRMRHNGREDVAPKVNPRIKKYSFGEAANDNIPQTIEEHPRELEEDDDDDDHYLTASSGSCHNDSTSPTLRNHAALLMVQRNSRRESGGSYGSSMDSMATDQTSLVTSLHDKRYSAATTTSALTPPTPIEPNNPNSNQFFPPSDDRTPYHRTQSAEAGYPLLEDNEGGNGSEQRAVRQQKPGSQLNDITLKLYRKSLQKKQFDDADLEKSPQSGDNNHRLEDSSPQIVVGTPTGGDFGGQRRERNSHPVMTRSRSLPDAKLNPGKAPSKSTTRPKTNQKLAVHDDEERQAVSQRPTYQRQNSSTSAVSLTRARTYSTTSRGSAGGYNTLRKTMARKNAERHLRVSRTVLAYVIVFSICWLPQRITYLLYIIEALVEAPNEVCWRLISGVRLLSFVSVLLNPAVYILTQRDFKTYVRNSAWGTRIRRWYAKCSRRRPMREDSNLDSRGRPDSSNRNGEVEMQVRRHPDDPELSGNNWQGVRSPYRMTSPQRNTARKSPVGGTQEIFAAQNGLNIMRHDETIDEMKEEEAAAEESLEKEMRRLAAEEEKRQKDDNRNFLEPSEDDLLSLKTTTGSGNKTTSSSSKSESLEQFWMRFLQSADMLPSTNGDATARVAPNNVEHGFPDLEQLGKPKCVANGSNTGLKEPAVLE